MSINPSIALTFATTLSGAFVGAWFAFLLDNRTKRKVADEANVRNGNLALYNLFEYWNALKQYHKEVIAPYEGKEDAWLNMPPIIKRYSQTPSLRDVDLSFILGTPHTNVYADVYLQEHRFHTVRHMIEQRDDIILSKARPAMTSAGAKSDEVLDSSAVDAAIGEDVVEGLKHLTAGIESNVPENLDSVQNTYIVLRGVLTEMYPKSNFIGMEFDLDDGNVR